MNIAAAVTTCPRTGVDYLTATLESLHDAGLEPLVVPDTKRAGSWPTMRLALECLLSFPGDAEGLVIFQDDIEVAAGLRDWLDSNLWPDDPARIGVCSLYCASVNLQPVDGWLDLSSLPVENAFGALAFCFPRRSAELFLQDHSLDAFLMGSDRNIATLCRKHGLRYMLHSPGFIRHVGEVSAIHDHRGLIPSRKAGRWISDCATMAVETE